MAVNEGLEVILGIIKASLNFGGVTAVSCLFVLANRNDLERGEGEAPTENCQKRC